VSARRVSIRYRWLGLAATFLLAACVSQETKIDAINAINREFQADYEAGLKHNGEREFNAPRGTVFDSVNAALTRLGLVIEQRDRGMGAITAEAPAPLPLDRSEWDRAAEVDLPRARAILSRYIGSLAQFFNFEPEGLDTVINATVIQAEEGTGTVVSFTMRLREMAPPKQNLPRREYPPPTAAKMGLDKIWKAVDVELAARTTKR
jgi:hypothetical protein